MSLSDASNPIHPIRYFYPPFIRIVIIIHTATYADGVFPLIVLIVLSKIRPTNMSDVPNPITFVCYNYFSFFLLHHPHHPGRRPMPRKIVQKFTIRNEKEFCSLPKNIKVSIIKHSIWRKNISSLTLCVCGWAPVFQISAVWSLERIVYICINMSIYYNCKLSKLEQIADSFSRCC